MRCVEKNTLEFKAMLCPVVAAESRATAKLRNTFFEKSVNNDDRGYKSRKEEFKRLLTLQYRHTLCLAVVSARFVDSFPFIREIDSRKLSDYNKLIIIMSVVEIPPSEIANFIESNPQSVKVLQQRFKEFIDELKGRYYSE